MKYTRPIKKGDLVRKIPRLTAMGWKGPAEDVNGLVICIGTGSDWKNDPIQQAAVLWSDQVQTVESIKHLENLSGGITITE